ncbi:MAG: ATP-binding protein [Bacteroidota bacterium]
MLFSEVIGHKHLKDHLIRMVQEERISHAQLFSGIPGSGPLPLALAFAQYVNCQNPGAADACGVCSECKKMSRLVHPDLHFVFPVVKRKNRKAISEVYMDEWRQFLSQKSYFTEQEWFGFLDTEKAQGMIYTDESPEIIKKLSFKNYEGKYKIMVVWRPEKMHNSAANRLLKILEEPPPMTLFLLVSESPAAILPTILSRTQQLKVPGIDDESMAGGLKKHFGVSDEEARAATRASQGDFIKAREFLDNSEEKQLFYDKFSSFMRFSYRRNFEKIIEWVDELASMPREQIKSYLEYSIRTLRESYMANFSIKELVFDAPHEHKFISDFSRFVHEGNVEQMVEEYSLALSHIEHNGNMKLVLFDMAVNISSIFIHSQEAS